MASPATDSAPSEQSSVDQKILSDLEVVVEKMDLCDSMLRPGGGEPAHSVQKDETLMAVIGFLEACAPRMVELVEAAAQGALSEQVLMKCLEVNDRLTKILSDIDTVALTETSASTTAASAPPPKDPFEEFLGDSSSGHQNESGGANVGGKSTGEDDPFGNEVLTPTPAAGGEAKAPTDNSSGVPASKSEDEFDSFFSERTSSAPKSDS